jgi:tRNA-Thr(GGU) m(6)t(6)A37 methyltransferase TsaA
VESVRRLFSKREEETMKPISRFLAVIAAFGGLPGAGMAAGPEGETFVLHPIGRVKTTDGQTWIELDKQYQPGLLGLAGFSHAHVFWWFDRNDTPQKRATLQVHPRGNRDNPLTGVFATRAPVRPNLIALSLCKIVAVEENVVRIEKIDALENTPVLDIKPYLPGYDTVDEARVPDWVREH